MSLSRPPRGGARSGRRAVRLVVSVISVVMIGVLVGACSGEGITSQPLPLDFPRTTLRATPPASSAPVPPGFTGFTSTDEGFSIAVPTDWRQVDPAGPGAARAMEDLAKNNEKLAPMLSQDLVAQGIKFLAGDGSGNSVNVVVRPAPGAVDADLPQFLDEIKAEYDRLGATLRSNETVRLAGHDALRLTIEAELTVAGGRTITLGQVQYFLLANDFAYVITLAGESPHFPTIASTFTLT